MADSYMDMTLQQSKLCLLKQYNSPENMTKTVYNKDSILFLSSQHYKAFNHIKSS